MQSTGINPLCDSAAGALVIIDVQSRLIQSVAEVENLIANCQRLIRAAALLSIPIVATEQYPKGLGHTVEPLQNALPDTVTAVEKTCFSCAGAEQFQRWLDTLSRPQIVLAGIESHVCVLQTALDLAARRLQVFIVEDAVSSRSLRNKENALSRLRSAGICITNTESVLFEWLKDARHPAFKEISALIR